MEQVMRKPVVAIIAASMCFGVLIGVVAVDKWALGVPSWVVAFPFGCVIGTAWRILEHKMEVR
jgi:hypothetical protein